MVFPPICYWFIISSLVLQDKYIVCSLCVGKGTTSMVAKTKGEVLDRGKSKGPYGALCLMSNEVFISPLFRSF